MVVAGGSTASVVLSAAFLTTGGAPVPGRANVRGDRAVPRVLHVVERGHVVAAFRYEPPKQVVAIRRLLEGRDERRNQRLALARRNHVGKERQRLGVDEGHRAANHHQRIVMRALLGTQRNAGQPQQREDVGVVPLERHRERHHVEVAHRRLRFDREQRRAVGDLRGKLGLRRQEEALADDVRLFVEELVHGLKPEVRHPDEVGVRKRQRHAQLPAVRFADVSDLLRQELESPLALFPFLHMSPWMPDPGGRPVVRELTLRRRRSRLPWVYLVYRVRPDGRAWGGPCQARSANPTGFAPRTSIRLKPDPTTAQLCRRRNAGTSSGESRFRLRSPDEPLPPAIASGRLSSIGARRLTVSDGAKLVVVCGDAICGCCAAI